MKPADLQPGSPPLIDAEGNLWLAAYDERSEPRCISHLTLQRYAHGLAGGDSEDLCIIGELIARVLLGVRPITARAREIAPLVDVERAAVAEVVIGLGGIVPCPHVCPECGGTCESHVGGCSRIPEESAEMREGRRLERERIAAWLRAEGSAYADDIEAGRHGR